MLPSFMIITIVMFLATAPIHALTIKVNENGSMIVQQGDVLGDDSEQEHENKQEDSTEQKEERKQEDKKDEQKNEQEKKAVESTREIQKKATEQQREESKIIRNINSGENKQVRVTNRKQKTEVLIENKKTDHQENETLSSQEKISTDRLNLELPAHPEVENETEAESANEDISQVKKERQQRRDKLEIQTQIQDDGTQEIQIEAGATKATLRSAEFTIDPATNTVLITTPNGEKHELVHLPDQVLQKFTDRGLLDSNDSAAQSALSIETDNEGNVVYRTKTKHTRHILGLIPYEVENEVELNDANGETSTQPVDSSLISRLLLGLSR